MTFLNFGDEKVVFYVVTLFERAIMKMLTKAPPLDKGRYPKGGGVAITFGQPYPSVSKLTAPLNRGAALRLSSYIGSTAISMPTIL